MPKIYRCKAILFDMDGTLVDSTVPCETLLRKWAVRHSLDSDYVVKMAHGRRNQDVIRQFTPHLDADEESSRLDQEELGYWEGTVAIRGAAEIISAIPPDMWALVTSASRAVAEMRLRCTGLPIPSILISSEQVLRGKPDPEGYLLAAERLGVEPEDCLVFEDAPAGIEAGLSANMQVLGITTTFKSSQLRTATCIGDFTCLKIGFDAGTRTIEIAVD